MVDMKTLSDRMDSVIAAAAKSGNVSYYLSSYQDNNDVKFGMVVVYTYIPSKEVLAELTEVGFTDTIENAKEWCQKCFTYTRSYMSADNYSASAYVFSLVEPRNVLLVEVIEENPESK